MLIHLIRSLPTFCIKVIEFSICNNENNIRDASILKYSLKIESRKRPLVFKSSSTRKIQIITPIFYCKVIGELKNQ